LAKHQTTGGGCNGSAGANELNGDKEGVLELHNQKKKWEGEDVAGNLCNG
jgi:hypothetical protein